MTIGFPSDRVWQAANWMVRGFCDDARPHLAAFPLLAERIERNFPTELWSFDGEGEPGLLAGLEMDHTRRPTAADLAARLRSS